MKKLTEKQSQLSDYATLLGCAMAAQMLRQIVYWYQLGEDNKPKLRIAKLNRVTNKMVYWISKSHHEWFDELGFSRQNTRTALAKLEKMRIIESKVFRFGRKYIEHQGTNKESFRVSCAPTKHIRLLIAEGQNHLTYKPDAGDFAHYATVLANQSNQSNQSEKPNSSNYKKAKSTNTKGQTQPNKLVSSNQSLTDITANTTTKNTTVITATANTSGSQNPGTFFPKSEEQNQIHHTGVTIPGNTSEWLAATNQEYDTFPEVEPVPEYEEH